MRSSPSPSCSGRVCWLLGAPLGWNPVLAIGWCIVIVVAGFVWSIAIYERKSVR